jgi:hypothetical protein
MTDLSGHCHCGAIRVEMSTALPTRELPLRACQCSFCRRHGALTTSDPDGRLRIEVAPGSANRYRFGLGITDFLLCAECGVYVAATMESDGGLTAVVNVTGVGLPGFEGREPSSMTYDDETPEERTARRGGRWMPATFVETQPSA